MLGSIGLFRRPSIKTRRPNLVRFSYRLAGVTLFYYLLFISGQTIRIGLVAAIYAAVSGCLFSFSGALFFRGLERGPVSLVSPIASTYPLFISLIVVLFFSAHLTFTEIVGIALIIVGVSAAAGLFNLERGLRKLSAGLKLALWTSLVWGLGFATLAQAINLSNWWSSGFIELIFVATFTSLFVVPFMKHKEIFSYLRILYGYKNIYVWLNSLVGLLGVVSIYMALSKSSSNGGAIPTAVSSVYPVITILLALNRFKENVSRSSLAGALLGIGGVVVLSL
ncbi:MAG TPA: EamA family transporter [Candidatus Saccharimonadales bacterium]|nr:EamA family transporter [Candidatus Saccharimonadales bacterium]